MTVVAKTIVVAKPKIADPTPPSPWSSSPKRKRSRLHATRRAVAVAAETAEDVALPVATTAAVAPMAAVAVVGAALVVVTADVATAIEALPLRRLRITTIAEVVDLTPCPTKDRDRAEGEVDTVVAIAVETVAVIVMVIVAAIVVEIVAVTVVATVVTREMVTSRTVALDVVAAAVVVDAEAVVVATVPLLLSEH